MGDRLFAVIGMHRSGTSLLARLLNVLGVDLGPEAQLMRPRADNPKGFWEHTGVVRLHDELLDRLGGGWARPPLLPDGWELAPDLDGFRARTEGLARSVRADSEAAAWKDPRGSLLLPLWQTTGGVDATVLSLRHPAAVAASLAERDGFNTERSATLWLRYTVAARRTDPAGLVVRFDDLFDNLEETLESLVAHLALKPVGRSEVEAAHRATDAAMRHHHDVAIPTGPAMDEAVSFYEILSSGADPGRLIDALHERWLFAAERDTVASERDELRQRLEEEEAQAKRLGAEIDARDALIAALRGEVTHRDETMRRLDAEVDARRAEVDALRASKSWRLTAPLRAGGDRLHAMGRILRTGRQR